MASIRLTDRSHWILRRLSEERGEPMTEVLRQLIDEASPEALVRASKAPRPIEGQLSLIEMPG